MAKLLVFSETNTHPDPTRDREGCYKPGDPVALFEDDAPEVMPRKNAHKFYVVDLPGPAENWQHLLDGEPRTLRDDYPRCMMPMKRLHNGMRREMKGHSRRRKGWSVAPDGTITRKSTGV